MLDLNVGVGCDNNLAAPIVFDCLNADVQKLHGVELLCDVQHLPFRNNAFRDVYCYHTLEHVDNPAKGLSELIRVASRCVQVEVPHRFGRMAKSQHRKKGNIALYHVASFRLNWFHQCLKNYRYCIKILYEFPRDLAIHVWIYLQEKAYFA